MSRETSSFLDISAIESPSILSWRIEYALDMLIIPSWPPRSNPICKDQVSRLGWSACSLAECRNTAERCVDFYPSEYTDLALSDPESYSIEEKREIIEGMRESTEKVDRAMREDFESMPPEMQRCMFEMLASSGPGAREFWTDLLFG